MGPVPAPALGAPPDTRMGSVPEAGARLGVEGYQTLGVTTPSCLALGGGQVPRQCPLDLAGPLTCSPPLQFGLWASWLAWLAITVLAFLESLPQLPPGGPAGQPGPREGAAAGPARPAPPSRMRRALSSRPGRPHLGWGARAALTAALALPSPHALHASPRLCVQC